jgi:putative flavoprotein involved in K+ transport
MHTWGSGRFLGIDHDARHIATTIAATYETPLRLAANQ